MNYPGGMNMGGMRVGSYAPLPVPVYHHQGNFFPSLDDSFLARAEALQHASEIKPLVRPDAFYGHGADTAAMSGPPGMVPRAQMSGGIHGFGTESMLEQISSAMPLPMSMTAGTGPGAGGTGPAGSSTGAAGSAEHNIMASHGSHPPPPQMYNPAVYSHPAAASMSASVMAASAAAAATGHAMQHLSQTHHHHQQELEYDPRELEAFAEKFKQRRIKLGVTQCDVGKALGNLCSKLKLPGVGSLSQSTICRFESLTLSHNNMVALKPVLQSWLEMAERDARDKRNAEGDLASEKKRKRTSIAAPEKRSLEAYFNVQPRPSGEKIAQIADKLDLKKNVVRVWFCNQRQKQKRMKFSTQT